MAETEAVRATAAPVHRSEGDASAADADMLRNNLQQAIHYKNRLVRVGSFATSLAIILAVVVASLVGERPAFSVVSLGFGVFAIIFGSLVFFRVSDEERTIQLLEGLLGDAASRSSVSSVTPVAGGARGVVVENEIRPGSGA